MPGAPRGKHGIAAQLPQATVRAGPGNTTKVIWRGSCKRKNTSDSPPEGESDAGVKKLIKGVYRGGLDNLKKMLES